MEDDKDHVSGLHTDSCGEKNARDGRLTKKTKVNRDDGLNEENRAAVVATSEGGGAVSNLQRLPTVGARDFLVDSLECCLVRLVEKGQCRSHVNVVLKSCDCLRRNFPNKGQGKDSEVMRSVAEFSADSCQLLNRGELTEECLFSLLCSGKGGMLCFRIPVSVLSSMSTGVVNHVFVCENVVHCLVRSNVDNKGRKKLPEFKNLKEKGLRFDARLLFFSAVETFKGNSQCWEQALQWYNARAKGSRRPQISDHFRLQKMHDKHCSCVLTIREGCVKSNQFLGRVGATAVFADKETTFALKCLGANCSFFSKEQKVRMSTIGQANLGLGGVLSSATISARPACKNCALKHSAVLAELDREMCRIVMSCFWRDNHTQSAEDMCCSVSGLANLNLDNPRHWSPQPAHVDIPHKRTPEKGEIAGCHPVLGFTPLTDAGMALQVWPEADKDVVSLEGTECKATVVFIPLGTILLTHGGIIHGGNLWTGSNGSPRLHFYFSAHSQREVRFNNEYEDIAGNRYDSHCLDSQHLSHGKASSTIFRVGE